MRRPIIAGNWKMHTTVEEAITLAQTLKDELDGVLAAEPVLCPPFIALAPLARLLAGSTIALGAQNLFYEDQGPYTGEISPLMLAPLCQYVIIGHSERRKHLGETDEVVNRKIKAALRYGLRPILCVGEDLEQNEAGVTESVIKSQLLAALEELEGAEELVIAYEPIWAIGTGRPATGAGANQVISFIRSTIEKKFGPAFAQRTRIQYGGSVTSQNIVEFLAQPEIDGALVGGASLRAAEFTAIVREAARAKDVRIRQTA
ncbi:MAG: triose-phosphate isomerase [Chloroflexi bacterium]|nr:triose-phosphate isomerase [Chloroflexota bacterium]